jgi:hypothetical protein
VARAARVTFIWIGVALALWLIPASIHIVDWAGDGPVRVALFAPLWKLWAALALAAIAIIATGVRHRGRAATVSGTVSDTTSDSVSPLLGLMWLWVVPYLPWLPDRAPILLALAGPLRWGVLALALAGYATAFWRRQVRWRPGRSAIFTASLAIYLFFGVWSARVVGPGADEPHYLVITQSLLRDHDLAIQNNHTRGDYREYFGGNLGPDFLRRGRNEVIYSIHAPGLPALLVPAYAAAGYIGAVVMICLAGALAALAVFDLATLLTGPAAAAVTWAAVCLTVPFVPHTWLIFPEMPGALIMAWAALWLLAPVPPRVRTWIWRGAALAILPWLHTKFVILLAAMIAAFFLRVYRNPRAVAALAAAPVVSIALWIYSFYRLYGAFDPQVPYGDFATRYVLYANIPRGLLGLLFDQKFGLLVYAPIYLIGIGGCWKMLRRPNLRPFGLGLIAAIAAFVASSTRMYMWWGGSSAPARFLVPILPLVAPMLAVAFGEMRSAARAVSAILLAASLAVAAAGVISPQRSLLLSAPHGVANMVEAAQGPAPLASLLPTFTEGDVRAPLALLAPWAIAALFALAVVAFVSRSRDDTAGLTAASAGLAAFMFGGAVLAGAPAPDSERRTTAVHGRLELLRAYDAPALRAFGYAHRAALSDSEVLGVSTIRASRAEGGLTTDARRIAGPFELPAGRFTARLTFDRAVPQDGSASVILGDRMTIAQTAIHESTALTFELPVDAAVRVAVSDEAAASVQQIEIAAESIVPRSARTAVDIHAVEPVGGRPGAYVLYADGNTYPEGGVFWTRATEAGKVFVVPGGASTLALTLHAGPGGGAMRVLVDGHDRGLTLAPNQTQTIEISLSRSTPLVPIVVEAPGSFRPADHESGSTDHRWLGCQVRIDLR